MSQWANEHPEQMAEIAVLPLSEQNAALREAMGYDPDAIRDRLEEGRGFHHHRPITFEPSDASSESDARERPAGSTFPPVGSPAGPILSRRRDGDCTNCGAPEGVRCQPWCLGEQFS